MLRKHWKKLILFLCCGLFCLSQIVPMRVQAASMDQEQGNELNDNGRLQFGIITDYDVDLDRQGSVRIHDRYGEGVDYYLYQVAAFEEEGPAYYTDAWTAYADELAELPDDISTSSAQDKLTEGLLNLISVHRIESVIGPVQIDADGYVTFADLEPGYYLIRTVAAERTDDKVYAASPILVSVPEGADASLGTTEYNILIEAKSELKDKPSETEPETDSPKTPNKPNTPGGKLPQTGVLWWPVPVLFAGGLFLFFLGVVLERRKSKVHRK